MANQATMNAGKKVTINSPLSEGVIGNLAEFAGDVTTLAELQAQLTLADLKTAVGLAVLPTAMIAGGAVLVLAALPVAMIGAAELIVQATSLQRGWAYLIVAGVAIGLSLALVLVGLPWLRRSFGALANSREEFARNVAWVKTVIVNSGRMVPSRRR